MATPKAKARAFQGISVRTEEDGLEARLDRLAAELSRRAAGTPLSRAKVAKTCMMRGLDSIEQELGLAVTLQANPGL